MISFPGLLLSALAATAPGDVDPPTVGQVFPDLLFPTLNGEMASLKTFRGTKVLLIQFASW